MGKTPYWWKNGKTGEIFKPRVAAKKQPAL